MRNHLPLKITRVPQKEKTPSGQRGRTLNPRRVFFQKTAFFLYGLSAIVTYSVVTSSLNSARKLEAMALSEYAMATKLEIRSRLMELQILLRRLTSSKEQTNAGSLFSGLSDELLNEVIRIQLVGDESGKNTRSDLLNSTIVRKSQTDHALVTAIEQTYKIDVEKYLNEQKLVLLNRSVVVRNKPTEVLTLVIPAHFFEFNSFRAIAIVDMRPDSLREFTRKSPWRFFLANTDGTILVHADQSTAYRYARNPYPENIDLKPWVSPDVVVASHHSTALLHDSIWNFILVGGSLLTLSTLLLIALSKRT